MVLTVSVCKKMVINNIIFISLFSHVFNVFLSVHTVLTFI